MNPHARSIADRLSLRPPQRTSLELLDRLCAVVPLAKDQDQERALALARSVVPDLESFDRGFPSYAFALATGVGKTRLMGAFIAYLARVHGLRHFFVLAPGLTIYRKLIADFTQGSAKYVFQGLAELATNPPLLVTGDDYEDGRGVRDDARRQLQIFGGHDGIHVNVFNIAKIAADERKGGTPRIRRLSECIGESYFEYLARLDDLVLVMDESHRYRAEAGARAIEELRPVLGLELTATPQVDRGGRTEPFRNVAYRYPLARAIADGFVKEPAVATRQDFDPSGLADDALERIKLEDGLRLHEDTKLALSAHAREQGVPYVKPFVLVIARDTTHASELRELLESSTFLAGAYAGKVIQVDSKQTGTERDEVVEKLLTVESPENPTEIVIHVNMLKEGWDVTNLYTIVPLRAANARNLVEQSIGRGLRLPYGRKTGVEAVDTLTIVAHDKFEEIVKAARDPEWVLQAGIKEIVLTGDATVAPSKDVVSRPAIAAVVASGTASQQQAKQTVVEVVRDLLRGASGATALPGGMRDLQRPAVQEVLREQVMQRLAARLPEQTELYPVAADDVAQAVAELVPAFGHILDVPRIVVVPRGEMAGSYRDFDLVPPVERPQPVAEEILVRTLQTEKQRLVRSQVDGAREERIEDYLVRDLIDFDDVSYDGNGELLYKLAGQMVVHLRGYLPDEESVRKVVETQHAHLAALVHEQLVAHFVDGAEEYVWEVRAGTTLPPERHFKQSGELRDFRQPPPAASQIGRYVFHGFARSHYPEEKFDSDPERRFAMLLEREAEPVRAWFRPTAEVFRIHRRQGGTYTPDFAVETEDEKLLCEIKARNELDAPEVLEAKRLAAEWCVRATEAAREAGTKPWRAIFVPDDEVRENATLRVLADRFEVRASP